MYRLILPVIAVALIGAGEPDKKKSGLAPQAPPVATAQYGDEPGTTLLSLLPLAKSPDGLVIFYDENSRRPSVSGPGAVAYRILTLYAKPQMIFGAQSIGVWSHMITNCPTGMFQQEKMTPVKGPGFITNGTSVAAVTPQVTAPSGSGPAAINRLACENAPAIHAGNRLRTLAAAYAFMAGTENSGLKPVTPLSIYPKAPSGKAHLLKIEPSNKTPTENEYFQGLVTASFLDLGSVERHGEHAVVWRLSIESPKSYLIGGDAFQAKNGFAAWQRLWVDCKARERKTLGGVALSPELKPGNYGLNRMEPMPFLEADKIYGEYFPVSRLCSTSSGVLPALTDIDQTIRTERVRLESEAKSIRAARP